MTPATTSFVTQAVDAGGLAFGVARLALAVAGLLWVLYVVTVVALVLAVHWRSR
ncbi:hypothetical protein FHU36_003273 [Nonomuraea muscovyensis]|uniref:Uncharacterized protein n=1 Tax=Nonomuraea muscovyensis TaxID=1124761 RepID=A0A7X0C1D9_9ACTN|nr:hypothetical protein [Nonomuraea muscovyensis]MBB6346764.1 hypothetical protein [Nonomuraea muscovyensis]